MKPNTKSDPWGLDDYIQHYEERKIRREREQKAERDARTARVREALSPLLYSGIHNNRSVFITQSKRPEVLVLVTVTEQSNLCTVSMIRRGAKFEDGHSPVEVDLTAEDGIEFMIRAIAERVVVDISDTHEHPALKP